MADATKPISTKLPKPFDISLLYGSVWTSGRLTLNIKNHKALIITDRHERAGNASK